MVFSESCSSGSSSSSSYLLCDVLVGDKILQCDEVNLTEIDQAALTAAECDVVHSESQGIWATYQKIRAVPRFVSVDVHFSLNEEIKDILFELRRDLLL